MLTIDDVRVLAHKTALAQGLVLVEVVDTTVDMEPGTLFEVRMQSADASRFAVIALDDTDIENKERILYYLEGLASQLAGETKLQDRARRGKLKLELASRSPTQWWYHTDKMSLLLMEVGYTIDDREILSIDRGRCQVALPPLMRAVVTIPHDDTPAP